ncbi:MAG: aldehyde dehydrogenase family protein [Theionarchaea archaeon]|nr:aldehyde dehydrogenase family protein [Theionarchaea archaeon]
MARKFQVITPVDESVYAERSYASQREISCALTLAGRMQERWKGVPIEEREAICTRAIRAFVAKKHQIAEEISWQMGRPIRHSPGEVGGFEERATHMVRIAEESLSDISVPEKTGFRRFIKREPLGVVLSIAPWNYPYLTAVNTVIPAIMAGNAVILKHSTQTPLCAERFNDAFREAGLPEGVFQYLHLTHGQVEKIIGSPGIDFVSFTGSVPGGKRIERAVAGRFIDSGLELGGKDPAYVRDDADLPISVGGLVDGAFFNSGQSCCGIKRIYVHGDAYEEFVEAFVELASGYVLDNPLDGDTTLGPVVRLRAAEFVREQVREAVGMGAKQLVDQDTFPMSRAGTTYLAPQVLVGVDHSMSVMTEESFGPVVGIMEVSSDEEAIERMNDTRYGLTASVWTEDEEIAIEIGERVRTGTWFMNRCDYLDPSLAWTGVKDSGRGCTLSTIGYERLTRPKSYHLKRGTRGGICK